MKVSLQIVRDSWNPHHPTDEVEFLIDEDYVSICIKGERHRDIEVNKEEFARLARFCKDETDYEIKLSRR